MYSECGLGVGGGLLKWIPKADGGGTLLFFKPKLHTHPFSGSNQILQWEQTQEHTPNTETNLFAAFLHHEEKVGAIGQREGKAVFERVGAIVVVADAVLVDVLHGEAAGLSVVLPVAGAFNGAVARGLDNGEGDGVRLHKTQ